MSSNKIDIFIGKIAYMARIFVMVRHSCYHMPVGLCNIMIEHGVGTQRFRSTLCSGLDLVSFPSVLTLALGLELGTRL